MGTTTVGLITAIVAVAAFLLGTSAVKFDPAVGDVAFLGKIDFRRLRGAVTMALALVIAFYLLIISIVATQIFEQRFANPDEPQALLQRSLSASLSTSSTTESLQEIASSLANGYVIPVLGNAQVNPGLDQYMKSVGDQFKNYTKMLEGRPKTFESKAKDESTFLLQQFDLQNHNHPGVRQTEAQVAEFSQYFGQWISTWISTAEKCRNAINEGQIRFAAFIDTAKIALQEDPTGAGSFPSWPDRLLGPTLANSCDFNAALSNLKIPPRDLVDPSLPVVISMTAGWLLATESRDLALITGVLGFGLFGALSTTFIRTDRTATGKQEASSDYKSVFVRGIAAAVLVFLVIAGGLAVFTRESTPNPYAVYCACLVAAVFSEDVWNWARRRQQESLHRASQHRSRDGAPQTGLSERE